MYIGTKNTNPYTHTHTYTHTLYYLTALLQNSPSVLTDKTLFLIKILVIASPYMSVLSGLGRQSCEFIYSP